MMMMLFPNETQTKCSDHTLAQTMVHPLVREANTNEEFIADNPDTSIKCCSLKLWYTRQYVRHCLRIDERCIFNSPDASFSKPLHSIIFIIGVIPLEEEAVAITLERQNMRCNAIQKVPIVRYHHGASRKVKQCLLQTPKSLDVEVVCWLVENDEICARFEQLRQLDAVALSTAKIARDA